LNGCFQILEFNDSFPAMNLKSGRSPGAPYATLITTFINSLSYNPKPPPRSIMLHPDVFKDEFSKINVKPSQLLGGCTNQLQDN
jgi:hypothetical protein